MEYKIKRNNVENVYEVNVNTNEIRQIINVLVRNCSYRERGSFVAPVEATISEDKKLSGALLPNKDPMFERIKNVYKIKGEDSFDSIGVDAVKVTPPKLTKILKGLIDGESTSIYDFIIYKNDSELVPIENRIMKLNFELEDDPSDKEKQKELTELCEDYKYGRYFDADVLSDFYDKARSLITLVHVRQTTYFNEPSRQLLKSFKYN